MENNQHHHRTHDNQRKTLYETYTDYIDPSEITVNHYLSRPFFPGQQEHLEKIKQWIESDSTQNKPLVFKTFPGVGVKTVLSRWYHQTVEENKAKKQKILPIIHFASNGGNSSNYFYCLYRIVIKLRQALKIKQNVDLLEEKIRKYFAYWLDICSTEIQRQQVIYCTQEIYSKIVIVIEGVDKFTDLETGKEANIAFWLPEFFPKNVKVICTVSQNSESFEYFEKKQCKILQILSSDLLTEQMLQKALQRETILKEETEKKLKNVLSKTVNEILCHPDTYKFIHAFSEFLLVESTRTKNKQILDFLQKTIEKKVQSLDQLSTITSVDRLYDFILGVYSDASPFKKKISQILMYFALSQKGITIKEIIQLTKFTEQEWNLFYAIFGPLIIKHQTIYSIKCYAFIESIIRKDRGVKQNKDTYLLKYHEKIAEALENTPNSIRKLEEQTYHLFVAKSYFKLKEIVSTIENFLLMFNPNNKYELSRYWQKLQEKGFDPVIEYNKAIEGFSMHYHPTDQNIFKIIVQISRFLKEFCDFETYQTPSFRHPFIEGNMIQLQKIGLLGEFTELQIYVDNSFNNIDQPQNIPDCSLEEQIKQVREQYFPKDIPQFQGTEFTAQIVNKILEDPFMEQKNIKKIKKKVNSHILSDIEQLNVDVPMNREKFRSYYLNSLQEYMKNEDYNQSVDEGFFEVQDEGVPSNNRKTHKSEFSVNKIKQNYKMRHIKPSLYYYKRWIWIQFPWVCISLNSNYSNAPQFCKQLQCEDIDSYEQEAKYTKQALIVAIEAKQKKKMMFTKKSDDFNGFGSTSYGSRMRHPNYSMGKFISSRNAEKSTMRSRVLQKTFSNVDLSLNTLTKELEVRKKNMPAEIKHDQTLDSTQGIFLSEINQNCQQDMKFINERRQFQAPDVQGLPSNQILPKLKWTIKDHTNYEINYIKAHIEEKKKKLNKIIFENKKLAETYKELKLKQNLTKKNMNEQQSDKHSRKIKMLQQYTQKKQDVINEFCKSLLQKQRLKIILKLCAENKTRNEEYLASLNYFLQNLKKMIAWERNNVKEITTQMNGMKALKERKEYMEAEKERNAKIVERQAKNYLQQKQKLEQQIENISMIIAQDLKDQKDKLENSLEGHLKNREEKNKLMMQQKKTKQLEQKLKILQQEYESLKQLFNLEGTDFQKSPKFQQLLEENEKNKKLKIIYFQKKNKLEEAEKQYEKIKEQYEKMKNQRKNEHHEREKEVNLKTIRDNQISKQSESQVKNTNTLKIMLSNISLKLGVKNTAEIVPFLTKKLNQLKLSNPIKYEQIMGKASTNLQQLVRC